YYKFYNLCLIYHPTRRSSDLQPLAQQRPRSNADGEHRQDQTDHRLVAVQVVMGKTRNLRQIGCAQKPEPGVGQQRVGHGARLLRSEEHTSELQSRENLV